MEILPKDCSFEDIFKIKNIQHERPQFHGPRRERKEALCELIWEGHWNGSCDHVRTTAPTMTFTVLQMYYNVVKVHYNIVVVLI